MKNPALSRIFGARARGKIFLAPGTSHHLEDRVVACRGRAAFVVFVPAAAALVVVAALSLSLRSKIAWLAPFFFFQFISLTSR